MIRKHCALGFLFLVGCSGRSYDEPANGRVALGPTSWIEAAELESRETLQNRCAEFAPLDLIRARNPTWLSCLERCDRAVAEEWQLLRRAAISQCIRSSGVTGCCFARRNSTETYLREKDACDSDCAAATHRMAASHATCDSRVVVAPESDRFMTATVRNAVEQCESTTDPTTHCLSMPTPIEHVTCFDACERRRDRARFSAAVDACVATGGGVDACRIQPSELSPRYSQENCEAACRGVLQGRRNGGH